MQNAFLSSRCVSSLFVVVSVHSPHHPFNLPPYAFFQEHINLENVGVMLSQALLFEEDKLQRMCLGFLRQCPGPTLLQVQLGRDLSLEALALLVDDDDLNVAEAVVFETCMACGKANGLLSEDPQDAGPSAQRAADTVKCKASEEDKQTFHKLLRRVRYPLMTAKEVAEHVVPAHVLEPDELIKIFTHIATDGSAVSGFDARARQRLLTRRGPHLFPSIMTSWPRSFPF